MESRKEVGQQLSISVLEEILENLAVHVEVARIIRRIEAEERYEEEGEAGLITNVSIWNCNGCNVECSKNVKFLLFVGVINITMLRWLIGHKLMLLLC